MAKKGKEKGGGAGAVGESGEPGKKKKGEKKEDGKKVKGGEKAEKGGGKTASSSKVPKLPSLRTTDGLGGKSGSLGPMSNELIRDVSKTSVDSKGVVKKKKKLNTESGKYVNLDTEWNSEEVRKTDLIADGYTCCIVMIIEEATQLTDFTNYLHQAVNAGIRKKFVSVAGQTISKKVKQFMTSAQLREPGLDDDAYLDRMDIWAEAIKHTLLQYKHDALTDIDLRVKLENEITGARSKEFVTHIAMALNSQKDGSSEPTLPDVSPKEQLTTASAVIEPEKERSKFDVDKKKQNKVGKKGKYSLSTVDKTSVSDVQGRKPKPTNLKKRGEIPIPIMDIVDDSPPRGPHSFFLLQGFYNPLLIQELKAIGVKIEGILLLTGGIIEKRNFSVLDLEENIPGTYKPRNLLPDYVRMLQKHSMIPDHNLVSQFWSEFAEMLNNSHPYSDLHDIALLNCPVPSLDPYPTSLEQKGLFAAALFDEASKRIYEMLVLNEWYQDYVHATRAKEILPFIEPQPQNVYERLINQVPAECVTVAVIVECLIEQVVTTMENYGLGCTKSVHVRKHDECAPVERGLAGHRLSGVAGIMPGNSTKSSVLSHIAILPTPLYIKSYDYASMRSCHLNETFAAHVASSQVWGDLHSIENFLWKKLPDFNKGLYVKLYSNLNHFMNFLPQGAIKFEDMFFILHLLMAAGVEAHLQEQAKLETANETEEQNKYIMSAREIEYPVFPEEGEDFASLLPYSASRLDQSPKSDEVRGLTPRLQGTHLPGTSLKTDHNYLALAENTDARFILASNSEATLLNVAPLLIGEEEEPDQVNTTSQKNEPRRESEPPQLRGSLEIPGKLDEKTQGKKPLAKMSTGQTVEFPGEYHEQEARQKSFEVPLTDIHKHQRKTLGTVILAHSIRGVPVDPVDKVHAAVVAAAGTIDTATDLPDELEHLIGTAESTLVLDHDYTLEETDIPTPPNTPTPKTSKDLIENELSPTQTVSGLVWGSPDKDTKRFVACEEEWFGSVSDNSALQALLECPALLAVSDNGALDLSSWIESYLFCSGLSRAAGEGDVIGDLKNWTFVEEYAAVQMIQVLSAAASSYLCMERMYCPFYDTLLFIFNNPVPHSLQADAHFYYRMNTLPGLQHFLEYTINDDDVLDFVLDLEKTKGFEVVDSISVTTLMRLVPEEQWMLIPSIKWAILREQKERERTAKIVAPLGNPDGRQSTGHVLIDTEGEEEEDDDFGQLKRAKSDKEKNASITSQRKLSEGSGKQGDKKRLSKSSEKNGSRDRSDKKDRKGSKSSNKGTQDARTPRKDSKKSDRDAEIEKSKSGSSRPLVNTDTDDSASFQNVLQGDMGDLSSTTSITFTETVKDSMRFTGSNKSSPNPRVSRFNCYDLGKRVLCIECNTFHLFPLDGTVISYNIFEIEPDYRMMQLVVQKNAYQSFFYPYYIPHSMDLGGESFVVCPYFHMVHSNGTIFAFQDLRTDDSPYVHMAMRKNHPQPGGTFSAEDIHFGGASVTNLFGAAESPVHGSATAIAALGIIASGTEISEMEYAVSPLEEEYESGEMEEEQTVGSAPLPELTPEPELKDITAKGKVKKGKPSKKEKAAKDKEKEREKEDDKRKKKDKGKEKKKKRGKGQGEESKPGISSHDGMQHISSEGIEGFEEEIGGEWRYPSSENTEGEEEEGGRRGNEEFGEDEFAWGESYDLAFANLRKKKKQYFFPWETADKLIDPLVHSFRITLPSGLFIQVDDVKGPPLTREVKQCYLAKGSASSMLEASRYYTSNGSVVKFMLNKTIQILTARGVTTNIRELSINKDKDEDEVPDAFASASRVDIYSGDIILPTGQFFRFFNGQNVRHRPLYVFTSGVMPNGEVFRRRQDGVTYLHRHDGTAITHYPDGTRFTTRMIILKDKVEDFEDWVFVGLKFMIEHPNYATVLFNTLSGNVHIRTSPGEWVRVFADGSIKIGTKDDYKLDVDKYRAVFSSPACTVHGEKNNPNLTAVKLYHSYELYVPPATIAFTSPVSTAFTPPKSAYDSVLASYFRLRQTPQEETKVPSPVRLSPIGSQRSLSPTTPKGKKKGQRQKNAGKGRANKHRPKPGTSDKNLRPSVDPSLAARISLISIDRPRSNQSMSLDEAAAELEEGSPAESLEEQPAHQTIPNQKRAELEAFISFTDTWTVCKVIDSWDNRFAVDVFGYTAVDKSLATEAQAVQSNEELFAALYSNFQVPKDFLSGILRATSSEDLATSAKRIGNIVKPTKHSSYKPLPKAKIFVVRRDLSGYEYLKKSEVDTMMLMAKNCRNASCVSEPLPGQGSTPNPRQLVTIMEPVENQRNAPHGVWKSDYREPVFRPRFLANKHLQVARPEDLRWFGYVLMSAHKRRPRFFLSPREQYLQTRKVPSKKFVPIPSEIVPDMKSKSSELGPSNQSLQGHEKEKDQKEVTKPPQENLVRPKTSDEKKKKKDGKGKKDKGKAVEENREENLTSAALINSDKKDKKGKKKNGKSESTDKKKVIEIEKSRISVKEELSGSKTDRKLSKNPNSKENRRKSKGRKMSKISQTTGINDTEDFGFDQEEEEDQEERIRPKINLEDVEIGEYPSDLTDMSGLYGVEAPEENAIRAQFHPDPSPTKKAIVVRSIVEIPKIDEKLQRALLAASLSYSKTIENHRKTYESYQIHDPRPENEKMRQQSVKEQLLQQNLERLHLFEQKEGNIIQFNI